MATCHTFKLVMVSIVTLSLVRCGAKSMDQLSTDDYPVDVAVLPTACNDLEDGYHWIRPMFSSDDFPNIYVKCVDGYTLLDPSLMALENHHHIKGIFSSYSDITDFMASASLNDHVTWREWLLPADEGTHFKVSEDCSTCSETEDFGSSSVYYMTGNYNGCLWITKGYCDMDPDTLECATCSTGRSDDEYTGLCSHVEQDADTVVPHVHSHCVSNSFNQFPSLGANGEFCVCYKNAAASSVPAGEWVVPEEHSPSQQTQDTVVEVFGADFESGTYRIVSPGVYSVMEDIELEMNAPPDGSSPNAADAWYPRTDQEDHYMGAGGSFIGPYAMGFFAGFAVEASNVTIELNGHEIKMSDSFHHQQRWFSIIEVGSKAFISGQGPANFGPYMTYANNVEIRNGVIGRSSHHGIHANGFENLWIHDVVVRDFEVAGIALNGFETLRIERVEVGPVLTAVPVMGVFTQSRIMLPRIRSIMADDPHGTVNFANRGGEEFTVGQLYDELVAQMDIMFEHNINGVDFEDMEKDHDRRRIDRARDLFENVNGLPSSSTVYGIFMNSYGASVFAISGSPGHSDGVVLRDVHIHGLYKDPWEVPRIAITKGPFNDILDLTRHSDDGLRTKHSEYIGSAYTDIQYAIHSLSEDWSILGHSVLGANDSVSKWISDGAPLDNPRMICNGDIMLHVTKGVFGLRMDNIYNVNIDGLEIDDLQNVGELGSYICGNYESDSDGGHRNQNYPLQRGYTGTEVHALSMVSTTGSLDNVRIHNIVSARGDAMAIQLFPSNDVVFGPSIQIEDIHAGAALNYQAISKLLPMNFLPNKVPRACAITIWTYTDGDDLTENHVVFEDKNAITAKCLTMHTECSDSAFDGEALDHLMECDDSTLVRAEAQSAANGEIYEKYISPQSPMHEKLLSVIQNHPEPDYFPPRAFPDAAGSAERVYLGLTRFLALFAAALVMALSAAFYAKRKATEGLWRWNTARRAGAECQPLIAGQREAVDISAH